jgi:class 3 adenylate cyclase
MTLPRRLAAVMFTDIVGYTALMQESEEAARVARLRHREALEAAIGAHGGELVQYFGDGSLSTFPSVVEATTAAVEVQRRLRGEIPLRVGIHQGEISFDEQGVYGDSVNLAARVMSLGREGTVLVSEKAGDELKNQPGMAVTELGDFPLKNVRKPIGIMAVETTGLSVPDRHDLLDSADSTRIYEEVTARWPRIALAVAVLTLAVGILSGGVVTDITLQTYVFAWAAATAGIWFLFDKAELAMSQESRNRLAAWLRHSGLWGAVDSVPAQFSELFDRVFGERHLTWRCFFRSAVASIVTVWVVGLVWAVQNPPESVVDGLALFLGLTLAGILFNLVPDYVSLLETRYLLRRLDRGSRLPALLVVDLVVTGAVGFSGYAVAWVVTGGSVAELSAVFMRAVSVEGGLSFEFQPGVTYTMPLGLFFYSTFFTSAWLWLYAAAVLASRVMLTMNRGVGFLLRATDVEYQPFRAMGFVSISVLSAVFAVGLPLLLL